MCLEWLIPKDDKAQVDLVFLTLNFLRCNWSRFPVEFIVCKVLGGTEGCLEQELYVLYSSPTLWYAKGRGLNISDGLKIGMYAKLLSNQERTSDEWVDKHFGIQPHFPPPCNALDTHTRLSPGIISRERTVLVLL